MVKDFREFVVRGNIVDLAVAVAIGVAFGRIVTSLITDVIMPPIGLLFGRVNFADLFINLSGQPVGTLAAAKAAGLPTINYGLFLNTVLDFLVVAFLLFLLVRQVNRFRRPPEVVPTTKECPYCYSSIPVKATRCPCTSDLRAA